MYLLYDYEIFVDNYSLKLSIGIFRIYNNKHKLSIKYSMFFRLVLICCLVALLVSGFTMPNFEVPKNVPPCFAKARDHKCGTSGKIDCNGPLGSCKCDDGSQCIWTNMAPVAGCPCRPMKQHDYGFIEKAKEFGCND
jgi:hypothetical protein